MPTFLCGGNYALLEKRESCPNPLHDWPLPAGYIEAHEIAMKRLRKRWDNKRCPDCQLYGWRAGDPLNDGTDMKVPHAEG